MRYRSYLCLALADAIEALEQSNPLNLYLDRLRRLGVDGVISAGRNDLPHLKLYGNVQSASRSHQAYKE
jgi:type I restriction enzyme R subunit